MPHPRRCNVRAGDHHEWQAHGDRFVCMRCKEPGPDLADALLEHWDARTVGTNLPLDERRDLLDAVKERAEMVLDECITFAAILEAEMAAAGQAPARPKPPPVGGFG
jgi:hypothetical protein